MYTLDYHREWLEHDGEIVTIDDRKCKLEVRTGRAIYPYEHDYITVYADMIDKDDLYYVDVKRQLGDDWGTDVLSMEPEKVVSLLETGMC